MLCGLFGPVAHGFFFCIMKVLILAEPSIGPSLKRGEILQKRRQL